ncbi:MULTISPECIES: hypothetical protein [unclassified Arthrobacter]|uniref:hypothetical protein n=1 Tax=unclassified Arthrobacter TaxID=235627 RepID=UPI001E63E1BC|nr:MULTISPECIES: hypothetical protein [unclassified Arthrobacter]MCC9144066.1 hypothetical protein [Arthrobacter sp. zg-Y919]MDK1275291.1 hypothetical protein [Arthrobacter sp. zg.Y919]WIB03314.1 hypothetical protein QNO10_01040 [Arthrobacter sp. zg-Y919]
MLNEARRHRPGADLQAGGFVCKVLEVAAAGTLEKRPSMAAKPHHKTESNQCALHGAGGKDSGKCWVRNGGNAFHGGPDHGYRELRKTPEWNKIYKHCSEEEKENICFPEYFRIASVV